MFDIKEKKQKGSCGNGTIYVGSVCGFCSVKSSKGSFTIEAAYILPVVLLCLFLPISLGIELHQETKNCALGIERAEVVDVISGMYRKEWMEDLLSGFIEEKNED